MKLEGDYAPDSSLRLHRMVSLVVVGALAGLELWKFGLLNAFIVGVTHMLPLACIWFPNAIARGEGEVPNRTQGNFRMISSSTIQWAGWVVILALNVGVWIAR